MLAGAEYVAKGNLIESGSTYYTVPFAPYTNGSVHDTVFATGSIGTTFVGATDLARAVPPADALSPNGISNQVLQTPW